MLTPVRRGRRGEAAMNHPVMWFEVLGNDAAMLREFYGGVFGWQFRGDNPGAYALVEPVNGKGIPGGIGATYPGTRSWVTFYVETPDINRSLAEATTRGGKVVMPRTELPAVTLAVFEDPEGHAIGLVEAPAA